MDLCSLAVFLQAGEKVEDLPMEELAENGDLLDRFGFDVEYLRWDHERRKKSRNLPGR